MADISETVRQLERLKNHCLAVQEIDDCSNYSDYIKALDTALSVLTQRVNEPTGQLISASSLLQFQATELRELSCAVTRREECT